MKKYWYIKDGIFTAHYSANASKFESDDDAAEITVPEGITGIGHSAFKECRKLTAVTLPDSVTDIGDSAFESCGKLKSINLPDGLIRIGDCAFRGCKSLTAVSIPAGVTEIAYYAFGQCERLSTLILPSGVEKIGQCAFRDCRSLTAVTLPDTLTELGQEAFGGCSLLAHIALPGGITACGASPFAGTAVRHVSIPAWSNACLSKLPDDVLIHTDSLTSVPAKRRVWAAAAFCEDNRAFDDPIGQEYAKYLKANASKIVTAAIALPAFMQALLREKLLTAKAVDAYHAAARKANDTALVAQLLAYQQEVLTTAKVIKTRAIKSAMLEEKQEQVVSRSASRADRKDLTGLVFAVTGKLATFSSRRELQTLLEGYGARLSASVTVKVDYLVTNDTSAESEKNAKAAELGVEIIDEKRLNEMLYRRFTDAKEVVFPSWVKEIPAEAFFDCRKLTSVSIPDSVTYIGDYAFSGCRKLTGLIIPAGVTEIGEGTFADCRSLTDVTIPAGVTAISEDAFTGCKNLTLHAPAGSYAETYARENNLPFAAL